MKENELIIKIPSKINYIKIIEEAFWSYISINKLENRISSEYLILALVEGVVNAIKHGNKMDCSKKVKVSLTLEKQYFKIIIVDRGDGFDPDCVLDPTLEENLSKKDGRGIFIMKKLMDRVEYKFTNNQTKLIMMKQLKE